MIIVGFVTICDFPFSRAMNMRSSTNLTATSSSDSLNYSNITYYLSSPFGRFEKGFYIPLFSIDPPVQSPMHNFSAKNLTVRFLAKVSIKKMAVGNLNY